MFQLVAEECLSHDRTYTVQEQDSVSVMFTSHALKLGYSSQDYTCGSVFHVPLLNEEEYLWHYYFDLHND